MRGISRSMIRRSGQPTSRRRSASSPSRAVVTSKPSSRSCSARATSRSRSSSTSRIRACRCSIICACVPPRRPVTRCNMRPSIGAGAACEAGRGAATPPSGRRSGSAGASGQASWSGRWAWQIRRPCWIRLTWASYIWSGSSMPRNRSWASSAVAFGPISPTRWTTRSTWRSTGMSGRPKREQQQHRGGLLADAVDRRSASRGPRAPACRRGTRASSRRVPRGCGGASPGSAAPSGWRGRPAGSRRSARRVARPRRPPSPAPPRPAARRRPSRRRGCADGRPHRPDSAARRASNATSAFMSALFWVRIVRISSLVGSRRRCQVGRPYSPASSSRTNDTSPGRYRSSVFAQVRPGSEKCRFLGRRRADVRFVADFAARPAAAAGSPGSPALIRPSLRS